MKQSASLVCVVLAAMAAAPVSAKDSSFGIDKEQMSREWRSSVRLHMKQTLESMNRELWASVLTSKVFIEQAKLAFTDSDVQREEPVLAFQENEQSQRAP